MDIMNMTLRQILQSIPHHPVKTIGYLLIADNILITTCAQLGWIKAETVLMKSTKFLTALLKNITAKTITIPKAPIAPVILMCLGLMFSAGCASAVLKSGCGHLTGNEVSIPYAGGKANGNAYGCYMSCIGSNCKAPDYATLQTLTSDYIKYAAEDNKITTTGPSIITVTPTK